MQLEPAVAGRHGIDAIEISGSNRTLEPRGFHSEPKFSGATPRQKVPGDTCPRPLQKDCFCLTERGKETTSLMRYQKSRSSEIQPLWSIEFQSTICCCCFHLLQLSKLATGVGHSRGRFLYVSGILAKYFLFLSLTEHAEQIENKSSSAQELLELLDKKLP